MLNKTFLFGLIASLFIITSCSDEELDKTIINNQSQEKSKEELMQQFASVLSEVVYEQEEVRAFFKEEALSQFDYNYDILWAKVRNEEINGKSIRERIIEKSSDEFVEELEDVVPTLNILFPELPMGFSAKTYETLNEELPVALRLNDEIGLYWNGICEDTLSLGEMPMTHVLVVNENKKVRVDSQTRSSSMTYSFVRSEFDNSNSGLTRAGQDSIVSAQQIVNPSIIYEDAQEAYKYFYTKKAGRNSYEYQRDYIYFGITPDKPEGVFNENVREFVTFIKVEPQAFSDISDEPNVDPEAKVISQRKHDFSEKQKQKFLTDCWTEHSFNFVFCIAQSGNVGSSYRGTETQFVIPAMPSDLWEVGMDNVVTWKAKKGNMGRHSLWKMTLKNFDKMKSKIYYIPIRDVKAMGNWDIRNESLYRYVSIYEFDNETDETYEWENQFSFVNKDAWNVKIEGSYGGLKASASYSNEKETKVNYVQKVTRKKHTGSNSFGSGIQMKYNDPIIRKDLGNGVYEMNTYTLGYLTFGVTATIN